MTDQPPNLVTGYPVIDEIRDEPMSHSVGPEGLLNLQGVQDSSERPTELGDVEGEVGNGGGEDVRGEVRPLLFLLEMFGETTLPQFLQGDDPFPFLGIESESRPVVLDHRPTFPDSHQVGLLAGPLESENFPNPTPRLDLEPEDFLNQGDLGGLTLFSEVGPEGLPVLLFGEPGLPSRFGERDGGDGVPT